MASLDLRHWEPGAGALQRRFDCLECHGGNGAPNQTLISLRASPAPLQRPRPMRNFIFLFGDQFEMDSAPLNDFDLGSGTVWIAEVARSGDKTPLHPRP